MKIDELHPEYNLRITQWTRCRAAFDGGDAIKAGGELYLPRISTDQTDQQYAKYKQQALWYGACRATLDLYTGMVFSKAVQYTGIAADDALVTDSDMAGKPFSEVMESALDDVIKFGRYGILVDFSGQVPPGTSQKKAKQLEARPYCAAYSCFDIRNWHTSRINGHMMLDGLILAEGDKKRRWLILDDSGFHAQVWIESEKSDATGKKVWAMESDMVPLFNGKPMAFIPFFFFDAEYGSSKCETPPLLELVDINISHYITMAELEHGRFFCGLPMAIFAGFNFKEGEKVVMGSSEAYSSSDAAAKAYWMEFTGAGLSELRLARSEKEDWLSHLGGGLLNPGTTGAEAAETMKIRRSGANATLASIASAVSMVGTKVLSLMSQWSGGPEVSVSLNTEFLPASVSPQEIDSLLKAVQSGDFRRLDFIKRLQVAGIIGQAEDADRINTELGPVDQGTLNPIGGFNG